MPGPASILRPARACLLVLVLLFLPAQALAETRAWLDRDRIELGETVTLNIESDSGGRPDYAPLQDDFAIEQRSSRQSWGRHGGQTHARTLYAVALQPTRAGVLLVPALEVGGERTAPITLTVTAPALAPAAASTRGRGPAWIEAELDDPDPYVQQAVGLRLRLYYTVQLVSGQLEQPTIDGIGLQRVGSDLQYTREIGGRRVQVVERRYVLVPERSGRIELPAASFRGRGVGGWLDDLFGNGQRSLSADGPALALDVRPMPDAAPRPWLPLRGLQMRWLATPDAVRAGDAFTVELELVAEGATAAQLEPPELMADQGAQVFPDPPQHDETSEEGRPRVRLVRRYSVLPAREGPLRLGVPGIGWWDVGADRARTASLEPLDFEVAAAAAGIGAWQGPDDTAGRMVRVPGVQGEIGSWALATVAFALLWLLTLAWGLHWRQRAAGGAGAPQGPSRMPDGDAQPQRSGPGRGLRRALDTGDLGDVAAALCGLASPPAPDLGALAGLLVPGPQREAIAVLQRARWGQGGDGAVAARAAVRAAFSRGPDWLAPAEAGGGPLPPLYPH